ncbi:MAG TPA: cytochrome c [Terracidiphilus sp.]|nr:cytochrome c [Terracidiphilus sp.]
MRRVAACLAACLTAFVAGCSPTMGHPPAADPRPDAVLDFATLYNENCAACHGRNGQNGPATDLGNPEYQSLIDDATLRKWIANGMPGTEMPAFAESAGGMLTEAQVDALVAGMRKTWRTQNAFAGATPPAYAQTQAGDAHRGAQAYQARCASCHKASGEEIASPAYLALIGDQALRTVIIAGRPDLGQPDWQHDSPGGKQTTPLTAQEVDDIVTYLGTLRNGSAQGGR